MRSLTKYFLMGALMLVVTAFVPTQNLQAQIFGGTETEEGKAGVCLEDPDLEKYPECKDLDCKDEKNAKNLLCMTETQAGTEIVGDAIGSTGLTHTDNFGDFIKKLVNFSLPYLTLAAFIGYVVAGFMYVTAFGNDEQLTKAKNILIWSSIGLVLVILSFAITQLFTTDLVQELNTEDLGGTELDLNNQKN